MTKRIELICVSQDNNNKYYNMSETGDGTWQATWGRVGVTETSMTYNMRDWDRKYRQKIKKGYTDVTDLRKEVKTKAFKDVDDFEIMSFLRSLHTYSNKALSENYTVSSSEVTQQQIDKAQQILNNLTTLSFTKIKHEEADEYLMDLYKTIPRKMKNVREFLLNDNNEAQTRLQHIIQREQDSVDNMAQSVSTQNICDDSESMTLEDALGIKITHITAEEIDTIKKLMGSNSNQFVRAFGVVNSKTQDLFEQQKLKSFKPWCKLLWHGSRNENWLSILNKGLMIRPTGVVLTGAMFGNGCYFANKAQKSIGYTSLTGSYWARGSHDQAYLALYDVNSGVEHRTTTRESWMCCLNEDGIRQRNCDSLYAQAGSALLNDELIVYNQNQSTIKYVVEIKK